MSIGIYQEIFDREGCCHILDSALLDAKTAMQKEENSKLSEAINACMPQEIKPRKVINSIFELET